MRAEGIYLKPGEAYLGDRHVLVSTILGSCVSVTMFHKSQRGRICHAVLPSNPDPLTNNAFHYVDSSMQYMLDSMLSTGISKKEIEVKAFGGANSFRSESAVGDLNAAIALRFVKKEGLKLCASDLGGKSGRKILFDTRTGMVLLKRLNTPEAQPLLASCSEQGKDRWTTDDRPSGLGR